MTVWSSQVSQSSSKKATSGTATDARNIKRLANSLRYIKRPRCLLSNLKDLRDKESRSGLEVRERSLIK
jgi:hypothetical protein